MTTWYAKTRDAFRTQLWPVPTIAVVGALLLGLGLPEVDAAVDGEMPTRVSAWFFGGDADAARALLGAIASSLITVTALTFSLTVVTLQLASSQFSPRLLRTFTADQFVQSTLALFLATFTYALTVLRSVRGGEDGGPAEVPQISVSLAFLFAVVSVLGLVVFLAHLAEQIRVETMLRNVHREATTTMRRVLPERTSSAQRIDRPTAPADPLRLDADADGFVTWFDQSALLEVATEEGAVVDLTALPGTFLVTATPIGVAWPVGGGRFDDATAERVGSRVAACVHTGFERTSAQDVAFGLRQLTDVASKALSPGINDPTTAIHALGHISAFLCALTDRDLAPELLRDEDDRVRVVLRRPELADLVDLGIAQPRRYGAADPQVLERILQVLLDLSRRVAPHQRTIVAEQLQRARDTVEAQDFDDAERAGLAALARRVEAQLGDSRPAGA